KTRLCTKWQTTGSCPYADRCNFAHGDQELQKVCHGRMHAKSVTGICMNWQQNNGHCSYGARCNFAH
ncbi:hypothetical protein GUITHDRAFT_55757, partial [Guillardia theta CCMP2712]